MLSENWLIVFVVRINFVCSEDNLQPGWGQTQGSSLESLAFLQEVYSPSFWYI
jgi:hypothetical protein